MKIIPLFRRETLEKVISERALRSRYLKALLKAGIEVPRTLENLKNFLKSAERNLNNEQENLLQNLLKKDWKDVLEYFWKFNDKTIDSTFFILLPS